MTLELLENAVICLDDYKLPEVPSIRALKLYCSDKTLCINTQFDISGLTELKSAFHNVAKFYNGKIEYRVEGFIVQDKYLFCVPHSLFNKTIPIGVFDAYTEDFIEIKDVVIKFDKRRIFTWDGHIKNVYPLANGNFWLLYKHNTRQTYRIFLINKAFELDFRQDFRSLNLLERFLKKEGLMKEEQANRFLQLDAGFAQTIKGPMNPYRKLCMVENIAIGVANLPLNFSLFVVQPNVGLHDGKVFRLIDATLYEPGIAFMRGDGRLFINIGGRNRFYEFV